MRKGIIHAYRTADADTRPRIKVISYIGLSRIVRAVAPEYEPRAHIEISDLVFDNALAMGHELERDGSA
ncbi:MAG: hypothetical protein MUP61_07690, partial [Burkholderiales bacterium]|nr:hypothetical protein [Burkholderiales bacterium]